MGSRGMGLPGLSFLEKREDLADLPAEWDRLALRPSLPTPQAPALLWAPGEVPHKVQRLFLGCLQLPGNKLSVVEKGHTGHSERWMDSAGGGKDVLWVGSS